MKFIALAAAAIMIPIISGCRIQSCDAGEESYSKMNMINVTQLKTGMEQTVVPDLRKMYSGGVIDSQLFIFTLVPEGNPAVDKASELAGIYKSYKKALAGCDIPVGILIQATIGHGWTPQQESEFQRFRPYNGLNPYMFCPLDTEFRKHIVQQVQILSELDADFFMLDDDVRMYTGRLGGCYCPLHLAEFNRRYRTSYDAGSLHEAVMKEESVARQWDALQMEGLLTFVRDIRVAISSSKPDMPGMFCACAGDIRHAVEIAKILAAPGQKPILRINNARYMVDSPKLWPAWTQKTAYQIAAVPKDFTILAETDTFPHSRYSTSGTILHSQYAWSLLAGCRGGKLWITSTKNDAAESGKYYRKMLSENRGFYQEISAMRPEYTGLVEPLPEKPPFNLVKYPDGIKLNSWATALLGFTGIPFSYEKNPPSGRVIILSEGTGNFSDNELKKFFSGTVLINGDAAMELSARGFSGLMGIHAAEWTLPNATYEETSDGKRMYRMPKTAQLKVLDAKVEILSRLYHSVSKNKCGMELAPGMTKFRNSLGGTVIVTSARFSPAGYQAYGMLNEARKNLLLKTVDCGIYYPGDAPLSLTVFRDRGILTLAVVNLSLDMLYELPLNGLPEKIASAGILRSNGTWENVALNGNTVKFTLSPNQIAFIRLQ